MLFCVQKHTEALSNFWQQIAIVCNAFVPARRLALVRMRVTIIRYEIPCPVPHRVRRVLD
jgi:hypothetical protein